MNANNMVLRAAVVIALGSVPVVGSAASTYAPDKPVVLAREITVSPGETVAFAPGDDYGLNLSITNLKGRTVDTNFPFEMRLTLTNGATFGTLTGDSLTCNYSGNGTFAATKADSVLQGATNKAVFKLPGGLLSTDDPTCVFTGAINLTSGSKGGNASYDMVASAYIYSTVSPSDSVSETVAGAIVTFKQAYQMGVTPNSTTIDVSSPSFSQKFLENDGQSAQMGTLKYAAIDGYNNKIDGTNDQFVEITAPDDDILVGDTTITLSGTPLQSQGTVVIAAGSDACNEAIDLAADGNAKTASVSGVVSFSVVKTDLVNADGVTFCYVVDGATRISKGMVTFEISTPTGSTTPIVDVAGDKTVGKFYKNGSSMKVLTIPDPKDVANPFNIRIYNMGASDTGIYGTLYNAKGERLGNANTPLVTSLKANAVKVLKTTDLAALFGVDTWGSGRAWLQIEGDSQQIRVQALAKTAGVMVNMSDRVIEDTGKFKRSDTQ